MAGPLFVFWFLLGVGFLSAAGRAGALADESISAKSPCPGGCPAGSTCNPKTRSCEATATKPLPIPSAPKSRSMESTITKAAPLIGNVNPFDVVLELSPDSGSVPIVACEVEPNTVGAYNAIKRTSLVMPLLGTTIYGRVSPSTDPDVRLEVNGWRE